MWPLAAASTSGPFDVGLLGGLARHLGGQVLGLGLARHGQHGPGLLPVEGLDPGHSLEAELGAHAVRPLHLERERCGLAGAERDGAGHADGLETADLRGAAPGLEVARDDLVDGLRGEGRGHGEAEAEGQSGDDAPMGVAVHMA